MLTKQWQIKKEYDFKFVKYKIKNKYMLMDNRGRKCNEMFTVIASDLWD